MENKISEKQIKELIEISREVIRDSALENGAIVATNTDQTYYPREAANYRWVWPRDASFICVAAEILQIPIQEPFFDWLYTRPKDFKKDKLLYANYSTNGQFGSMGRLLQIDQAGSVLWAIYEHFKNDLTKAQKYKDLIERLADGVAANWNKAFFKPHTVDLWEEPHRQTSTTIENNFTYSLAACARGLLLACEMIPNCLWKEAAAQMIEKLNDAYSPTDKYFYRNKGKISDKNIDASLLGLVWPFEIFEAKDERIINTISKVEEKIVVDGGVHRFEQDYFDGEGSAQEGGGAWPLLNFWMAIYWAKNGDREKALSYYNWVLERIEKFNGFIPEQIFDDFRVGVYPLVWSHAMFILASRELGFIK
ncbi:MAG: glycoside hydrolase family 15 protein [Patescibacteria group bacterium]|jgi:GH15 family glucan-1,4-alpha-glucosidase